MKLSFLFASIIFASSANAAIFSNTGIDKFTSSNPTTGTSVTYHFNEDSVAVKKTVTYNLKVYQTEAKDRLVDSSGVYNDQSSLLNISEGKLLSDVKFVGNPVGNISINNEKPYIQSVKTEIKDSLNSSKSVSMDAIKTGFDLTTFYNGNDIYFVNISQVNLEKMNDFTSGEDTIQLPEVSKWSQQSSSIYIPEGKTARFNSSEYSFEGKKYQNIYLLSVKK